MAENGSTTPARREPAAPATTGSIAVAAELRKLDTTTKGLSTSEATSRLARYGRNAIEAHTESRWRKLATYFWGPLPWMIEAAALISLVRRDWSDFLVVGGLLVYNAAVGFWQEYKASNALDALKKGLAPKARVLRDGTWQTLDAAELVPGDVVNVAGGQIVPADLLLIDGEYLSVDQAALTGESLPVSKKVGDAAYSGGIVKQGAMTGVVTSDRQQHVLRPHRQARRSRRLGLAFAECRPQDRGFPDSGRAWRWRSCWSASRSSGASS